MSCHASAQQIINAELDLTDATDVIKQNNVTLSGTALPSLLQRAALLLLKSYLCIFVGYIFFLSLLLFFLPRVLAMRN